MRIRTILGSSRRPSGHSVISYLFSSSGNVIHSFLFYFASVTDLIDKWECPTDLVTYSWGSLGLFMPLNDGFFNLTDSHRDYSSSTRTVQPYMMAENGQWKMLIEMGGGGRGGPLQKCMPQ